MSAKDSMAKEYFADNARFADLCNNILYGGREVILPENLKERDTTEVLTALGLDKKTIAMQKLRDIFKNASIKYTGKSYVVLIGVENQSDIHYAIPVKNMFYDVMAYGNQVKETAKKHRREKDTATSDEFLSGFTKEDKLIPVITITVYLGTKEWDGPRKLSDMFGDVDEELLPFIPDYRINLLAPREITDFTGFRTSIRQLFEVLKNAYDKEKMQEVLEAAKGKLLIFVTHRLSFARQADQILYLKNGMIAEHGTHEELMEKGGDYCRMFTTQRRQYFAQEGENDAV